MLQIISKKFFKSEDPDTYYSTEEKALIYSCLDIREPIITSIIKLERIEEYNGITTYLMSYTNNLEKRGGGGFNIVATGQSDIINDFCACCTLWFKAIFSPDKYYVQRLVRDVRENTADNEPTKKILPLFFTNRIINQKETKGFNNFITNLLLLKRTDYKNIINVIKQYYDAILLLNSNIDLAYTMFVATVESLSQNYDGYKTEWEDCSDNITKRFDNLFYYVGEEIKDEIKDIITEEFHLKIFRRYTEYSLKHIDFNYFYSDTIENTVPIKKSSIKYAINNSYDIRSKYVHSLISLPNEFSLVNNIETYGVEKNVTFSFLGLARFCRYIIISTLNSLEKVEKEEYDYLNDLPGMMILSAAPQYWIHNPDKLIRDNIASFFSKFIDYFLRIRLKKEEAIVDMRNLCYKIEQMFNGVNDENKQRLLMIHALYNIFIEENYRTENNDNFLNNRIKYLEKPSIEGFIFYCFVIHTGCVSNEWTIDELLDIYERYDNKRFWKKSIKISRILESCLLLELANNFLEESDIPNYDKYVYKAMEENPGDSPLIDIIGKIKKGIRNKIDWEGLYLNPINK